MDSTENPVKYINVGFDVDDRHFAIARRLAITNFPSLYYYQTSGNSIFPEYLLLPDVW